MNASTLVEINGQGWIANDIGNIVRSLSGQHPLTIGELFHRAEKARNTAKLYIEAAENMERLAKEKLIH